MFVPFAPAGSSCEWFLAAAEGASDSRSLVRSVDPTDRRPLAFRPSVEPAAHRSQRRERRRRIPGSPRQRLLYRTPVDLRVLARDCVDVSRARHRLPEESLRFEDRTPSAFSPTVLGDADELRAAVLNLVDNAVKYGGKAEVGVKVNGGSVEITIADEGPGIPEPEMERIFLPFYRLEPSRSRHTGGIGLGMAIAQMIVDAHSGSIDLRNRPEGGLRVRVLLPHSR